MTTLRVILPPGVFQNPKDVKDHKKPQQMKFKSSITVKDAIEEIIRSFKIKIASDQCALLLPPVSKESQPIWLEDSRTLSSYPFQAKDIVELKRRFQVIKIRFRRATQRVLVDINTPVKAALPLISKKFQLDNLQDYSILFRKTVVDKEKTIREQRLPVDFTFRLKNNKEDDMDEEDIIDEENETKQQPEEEDERPQESIKEQAFDPENIAAKDVPNPQKTGTLNMKITKKKKFESRWIVLKNNFVLFYKDQKEKKPLGFLLLDQCKFKLFEADEKEHKSKEYLFSFELISNETNEENIFKCESEDQLKSWMREIEQIVGEAYTKDTAIFGVPLSTAVKPGKLIPDIVEQCISVIDSRYLEVVGIFRLSGSQITIGQYKKSFDAGEKVDLSKEIDPHCVCGLLKLYFRELPEPLLTYERYDKFIAAVSAPSQNLRIRYLKGLISSLPKQNLDLLKYLVSFLGRVSKYSATNKMAIHNLATVFGPNLLGPPDKSTITLVQDTPQINGIVSVLIEDYDLIFSNKDIGETAVVLYDYAAVDESEISLKAGQVVKVINKAEDGWWQGELDGKIGRFPGAFVQVEYKSKKQMFQDEMQKVKSRAEEERALSQSLQASKKTLEQEIQALQKEKQAFEEELKQLKSMVMQICKVEKMDNFNTKVETFHRKLGTLLSTKGKLDDIASSLQQEVSGLRHSLKNSNPDKKVKGKQIEKAESQSGIFNMKVAADSKKRDVSNQRLDDVYKDLTALHGLLQR